MKIANISVCFENLPMKKRDDGEIHFVPGPITINILHIHEVI